MKYEKEILSQRILNYLDTHPQAGDTLEGIATWWLEQERIDRVVDDVADALKILKEKDVIRTCKNQTGATIYKIKLKLP